MSKIIGVSQGVIYYVLFRVRDNISFTQGLHGRLVKWILSKEDRAHFHIMRWKSFISQSRIRVELLRRIGRRVVVRMVQRCQVAVGYLSRHSDRYSDWILTIVAAAACWHTGTRNWNHQHWSHMLFTDESIVNHYNCDGYDRVSVMLLKGWWVVAFKKRLEFAGTTIRVVKGDLGLIIKYRVRPVLIVSEVPFYWLLHTVSSYKQIVCGYQ